VIRARALPNNRMTLTKPGIARSFAACPGVMRSHYDASIEHDSRQAWIHGSARS
jgi:hypothetical protein